MNKDSVKLTKATNIKTSTKIAAFFFVFLLIDAILFLSTAVYVGAQSGELENKIIKPLTKKSTELVAAYKKSLEAKPVPTIGPYRNNVNVDTNSSVRININNNTSTGSAKKGTTTTTNQIKWVYPTYPPSQSYEEIKKAQDEWWAAVQKQNQDLSNQSKATLDQFSAQSKQNLENFKSQGQVGMEEFKQKALEDQQKFLQDHGVTP